MAIMWQRDWNSKQRVAEPETATVPQIDRARSLITYIAATTAFWHCTGRSQPPPKGGNNRSLALLKGQVYSCRCSDTESGAIAIVWSLQIWVQMDIVIARRQSQLQLEGERLFLSQISWAADCRT